MEEFTAKDVDVIQGKSILLGFSYEEKPKRAAQYQTEHNTAESLVLLY